MGHLPLNIDMRDRPVLVAGGGRVAARKVRALLETGARVQVVALEQAAELAALAAGGRIALRSAAYAPSDLQGMFLAVAATDDAAVNAGIAADARALGILCVVADSPGSGDCTFPAVLRRGGLEISVSTGGRCPAFAARVRDIIAGLIGEDFGVALEHLAGHREKLLTEGKDSTYNGSALRSVVHRRIKDLIEHDPLLKTTLNGICSGGFHQPDKERVP